MIFLFVQWCDIDVLVNNVGLVLGFELVYKVSVEDWEIMIDINNKGLIYMICVVLSGMVECNCCYIINIGLIVGSWFYVGGNVYGVMKVFVCQFSLNLCMDLYGMVVCVIDIELGLVGGIEFFSVCFKGDDEKVGKIYENIIVFMLEDIIEVVWWVVIFFVYVNINIVEMMFVI